MKEVIQCKAISLFTKHGIKAVTMDDIAKNLSISKKTIYAHYSSKDELINETIHITFEKATARIKEIIKSSENAIQEMFAIKNGLTELFGFDDNKAQVIFELNKYYPKIAQIIFDWRLKEYENIILKNIQKGIAQGLYRKDLPIAFIGKTYFVITSSFFNQEFEQLELDITVDEIHQYQIEYHIRSIVTEKGQMILEKILKENPLK